MIAEPSIAMTLVATGCSAILVGVLFLICCGNTASDSPSDANAPAIGSSNDPLDVEAAIEAVAPVQSGSVESEGSLQPVAQYERQETLPSQSHDSATIEWLGTDAPPPTETIPMGNSTRTAVEPASESVPIVADRDNASLDPTQVNKADFQFRCDRCKNAYTTASDLATHRERRNHPPKNPAEAQPIVSSSSSTGLTAGPVDDWATESMRAAKASRSQWELDPSELELSTELGRGAFGVVFLAQFHGTAVAVKQLKSAENAAAELNAKEREAFQKEAELMERLPAHRNVVGLVGVITKVEPNCIVTEFAANGSLESYLRARRGKMTPSHRVSMAVDACDGVRHLHSHKLIHRDIAARNFLIHQDGRVLVADFGMSRQLPKEARGNVTKQRTGPLRYMAPESLGSSAYSTASDVWAFGILLWEIETGGLVPYGDLSLPQVAMQVVMEGLRLDEPPNCVPGLYDIMRACWTAKVKQRAKMADVHEGLLQLQQQTGRLDMYFIPLI